MPEITSAPLKIGMILFPNLTQLDLTGPYEVLSRLRESRLFLVAETLEPVRSERGLAIVPDTMLATCPPLDMVFVPGGPGINEAMENEQILGFLRERAPGARYITSVCTGALILGAAGLLQGYRATTHWLSMDLLELFGAQPVSERVVIDRNRITAGGVTSGIDFALRIAAELRGEKIAQEIELTLEYDPEPPFHSGSVKVAAPALVDYVISTRSQGQATRRAVAERAAARLRTQN